MTATALDPRLVALTAGGVTYTLTALADGTACLTLARPTRHGLIRLNCSGPLDTVLDHAAQWLISIQRTEAEGG